MADSLESVLTLLQKWCHASSRLHFALKNGTDGWVFTGFDSIKQVSTDDGELIITFSCGPNFRVSLRNCVFSISDPRKIPEGMSFPASEEHTETPYVSETFLSIIISEKTFLMIADIIDHTAFGTV